jgi:tRNA/tmRNA/rRNA uracil-C5-methylase (TrmA/RlmC/RlmD family)
MRDCTRRGDVVLDTFSGSGTTIMAAERIGRRAYAMEVEPRHVDVAIRRWQAFTRKDAVDAESGRTFDQLAAERTPDDPRGRTGRQGNQSESDEALKETSANREGLQSAT